MFVEASPENFFATSEDDWDKALRVNVCGTGLVTQAVASRMTSGKTNGSIINMASCFGTERGVIPGIGIYSASKAAIVQLTKVGKMKAAEMRFPIVFKRIK